ncbi:MAG: SagB/ThcOx family dehydrogenase [Candidatus Mcinerneyibacterium aminivorans]|uniref:SagB/ThcOx family dehydrogenase n=1 Tax=Candidatus Mcinerneyibacterium aminivorans TaxID=2703815 RepID=A0A5D0MH10_9BACT|nr:MAG: SagB/ThcOx family dehydrogenase [Candidatus Mcinerneyibacterium aminivorans]
MTKKFLLLIVCGFFLLDLNAENLQIKLPEPIKKSNVSIEKALENRRSIRSYSSMPVNLEELSQLLWAAQGVTNRKGFRTAPSAGALYPLKLYVVVENVKNLEKGIYMYKPEGHKLIKIKSNTNIEKIYKGALNQQSIKDASVNIIFGADFSVTDKKYRKRGKQYVYQETGHAAQNIYLQSESLNIGTVVVGAFYEEQIKKAAGMGDNETPICIMPAGKVND